MNKKLFAWVSVGVVIAILFIWAILRLSALGQSKSLPALIVGGALCLLALPMNLYVIFVLGEDSNWPLPILLCFLMLSGLMWGIIVERIATLLVKLSFHDAVRILCDRPVRINLSGACHGGLREPSTLILLLSSLFVFCPRIISKHAGTVGRVVTS